MSDVTPMGGEAELQELNRSARQALQSGQPEAAVQILRRAVGLEPRSVALWLNLSGAHRQTGDWDAALEAVEEALKLDPRDFNALLLRGALLDRAGATIEAGRAYGLALMMKPANHVPDSAPQREAIARAQAVYDGYAAELREELDKTAALMDYRAPPLSRVNGRNFIDYMAGRRKVYHPSPTQYYFPGLPAYEFYDRSLFPWIERFEQFTDQIRAELDMALTKYPEKFHAYVNVNETLPIDQWAELNRSANWSAFDLIRAGVAPPGVRDLFPKTFEALRLLPQPVVPGRTPSAMFSALKPTIRIPPHCGVTNARLVVHLPLIIPKGCGFRVGNETREWKVGEAWVFDDTVEHEAWNGSDELRVILIADIWNVFMTEAEQKLYAAVVEVMDQFTEDSSHDM